MLTTNELKRKKWATTRAASDYLNVSQSTLYLLRKNEVLKANRDWRRKFPSPKSGVLYDLARCEKTLIERFETDPETLQLARTNK